MPLIKPNTNDTVETLIQETNKLALRLSSMLFYRTGPNSKKTNCAYYSYTNDECLILQGQLMLLIKAVNNVSDNDETIVLKKRLLHATFLACSEPSAKNSEMLMGLATKLPGKGNIWARVGLIALGIALTLVGILPGVFYFGLMSEAKVFDKYKSQGLSKATETLANEIAKTASRRKDRFYGFFPASPDESRLFVRESSADDTMPPPYKLSDTPT